VTIDRNPILAALALALGAALAASPAGAQLQRWFYLSNSSEFVIEYAYATNVDDRNWGSDLIPNDVIEPGYRMKVEPPVHQGYCRFDIRLEFKGLDSAQVINDVNLCEATEVITFGVRDGGFVHEVR
jgi:hypothetical protein